jgi:hypothetical protein
MNAHTSHYLDKISNHFPIHSPCHEDNLFVNGKLAITSFGVAAPEISLSRADVSRDNACKGMISQEELLL